MNHEAADEEGDRLFREDREDGQRTRFCPSCNLIVVACPHKEER